MMQRSSSGKLLEASAARERWFVDVLVVEGKHMVGTPVKVTVCLESAPEVRFISSQARESDHVWNSDCSFVFFGREERLHVSLVSKSGKSVWGKCTVPLARLMARPGPPTHLWYNLRDVYDAVVIVEDTPLRAPDASQLPFGYLSAGLIHLQIQVSQNASDMFLSKNGTPLRLLPFRVQAGDLLFVSSKKLATTGTKIATRSRWDHVALVINYKSYQKTYVLQSNTQGVQVNEAEATLKSYWDKSRAFGVRRLLRPANSSFVSALSDFAEKNQGKGYNYNLIQILGGGQKKKTLSRKDVQLLSSSGGGGGSGSNSGSLASSASAGLTLQSVSLSAAASANAGGGTTFAEELAPAPISVADSAEAEKLFCSQLVAAAYMSTGVMESGVATTSFLPATFARSNILTKSGMQLLPLCKFPCFSPKSEDIMWAREESALKQLFRDAVTQGSAVAENDVRSKLLKKLRKHLMVVAVYSRSTLDKTELSFEEGDTILVLEKDPSGWWTGQLQSSGRIGFFPANFTALLGGSKKMRKSKGSGGSGKGSSPSLSSHVSRSTDNLEQFLPLSPNRAADETKCASCSLMFSEDDPAVVFGRSRLHEKCLEKMMAKNIRCGLCGERVAVELPATCADCERQVCVKCFKDDLCRVCNWEPSSGGGGVGGGGGDRARESSSSSSEVLIALRSHQAIGSRELAFHKGDEIELVERTDFGWAFGHTDLGSGLFPQSAVAAVVKKFSLRRLRTRKLKSSSLSRSDTPTAGRKSPMPKLPLEDVVVVSPKQAQTPRLPIPALPPLELDEVLRSSAYSTIMVNDEAQLTARNAMRVEDPLLLSDTEEDSVESETDDDEEDEIKSAPSVCDDLPENDLQEDEEESDSS